MANARSSQDVELTVEHLPPGGDVRPQVRRLMAVAVAMFAERGYHGVSVRDLAAAIGIKAGSFYSHFPSKEQLLFDVMLLGHQAHQAEVRNAILSAGPEPAAQLRRAIVANVLFHGTYPLLTIVGNSELHALAPDHSRRILELRHESGVLVAAVIQRGDDVGVFDCKQPWLALSAIAGMGVRVAWWFRPSELVGDETPLSMYPAQAAQWFPDGAYTLDEIADRYAEYALKIVAHAS